MPVRISTHGPAIKRVMAKESSACSTALQRKKKKGVRIIWKVIQLVHPPSITELNLSTMDELLLA